MTKFIPLSQGKFTTVDDSDYEWLSERRWTYLASKGHEYAVSYERHGDKVTHIRMHRLIMNAPDGVLVDHADGYGLNNTRANLRLCNSAQNMHNTKKRVRTTTSQYKGVKLVKGNKWMAMLQVNGERHYIGTFDTEDEAALAYDNTARHYHGQFARLNFPDSAIPDDPPPLPASLPRYEIALRNLLWHARRNRRAMAAYSINQEPSL